jgi:hypothetical protein
LGARARTPLRIYALFAALSAAFLTAPYVGLPWLGTVLWWPVVGTLVWYLVAAAPVIRHDFALRRRARAVRRIQGGAR